MQHLLWSLRHSCRYRSISISGGVRGESESGRARRGGREGDAGSAEERKGVEKNEAGERERGEGERADGERWERRYGNESRGGTGEKCGRVED